MSHARPKVTSSRFKTKSSSLLRRATNVSQRRITCCPPISKTVTNTTALNAASISAVHRLSPVAPKAGINTSNGTTAKSWNSKTPITRLPCSDSTSKRSTISLTTMAVLLMAKAPESASAVFQSMPQSEGDTEANATITAVAPTMVSETCNKPRPNTCLRMAWSLGKLNSNPMTNIRKTTPYSPKCPTAAPSFDRAKACGPKATPTAK